MIDMIGHNAPDRIGSDTGIGRWPHWFYGMMGHKVQVL